MTSIRIARFWCFFYALQRTKRNNSEQSRTSWIKLEQATLKSILAPRIVTIFAMSSEMSSRYVSGLSLEKRELMQNNGNKNLKSGTTRRGFSRTKPEGRVGTDSEVQHRASGDGRLEVRKRVCVLHAGQPSGVQVLRRGCGGGHASFLYARVSRASVSGNTLYRPSKIKVLKIL